MMRQRKGEEEDVKKQKRKKPYTQNTRRDIIQERVRHRQTWRDGEDDGNGRKGGEKKILFESGSFKNPVSDKSSSEDARMPEPAEKNK